MKHLQSERAYKDLQEEQQTRTRGGGELAYDQK
jgi:hypothetical protein